MTSKGVPVYSAQLAQSPEDYVPVDAVQKQLEEFYTVYKPENSRFIEIDKKIDWAKQNGLLELRKIIYNRYKADLYDADSSEAGWIRIKTQLRSLFQYLYEKGVVKNTSSSTEAWYYKVARSEGVEAMDAQLKNKYDISFVEFSNRTFNDWKSNWEETIDRQRRENLTYELKRFYYLIERAGIITREANEQKNIEKIVGDALEFGRDYLNELLLNKYKYKLEDVPKAKGNSHMERKAFIKTQLIDFLQENDPEGLGKPPELTETAKVEDIFDLKSQPRAVSEEEKTIDELAESGVIEYEGLNDFLRMRYNKELPDENEERLKQKIVMFYEKINVYKSPTGINDIVRFGLNNGEDAINEKLVLHYGRDLSSISK